MKSATKLGMEYGVNGEEMNYILHDQGFLRGGPGNYEPTEKGLPYVHETDYHRGCGGYSCYNRYWTTLSWDENICDELDLSSEAIENAKTAVSDRRRMKREARIASYDECLEAEEQSTEEPSETDNITALGILLLVVIESGIVFSVPKAASWFRKKIAPKFKRMQQEGTSSCEKTPPENDDVIDEQERMV